MKTYKSNQIAKSVTNLNDLKLLRNKMKFVSDIPNRRVKIFRIDKLAKINNNFFIGGKTRILFKFSHKKKSTT
jgi:hypothetical protein